MEQNMPPLSYTLRLPLSVSVDMLESSRAPLSAAQTELALSVNTTACDSLSLTAGLI